ncbi:hypothetical protein Cpar_1443 [Chlorobaculum parvum NCIB 8327]|uniref:Uncharacterized protein n=1 Tax=Chlorobaculum parvum (strain DSM 263 / NCIMB 8327) TaxID=517417 RepID=B3QPI9_CHLP8|nr:hypothetical protein [Chlorobaculum parvum]ACF11842.1 hypothetical protein Cpar_1443 [Chlorobaculum parvum NCIB 8327]
MDKSDMPTDRQIKYAQDLGVRNPQGIRRSELSELIDEALFRKYPPSDRNLKAASDFGIEVPKYITKRALFDLIWNTLENEKRDEDLASWYAYRICRSFVKGAVDHPEANSVISAKIKEIGKALAADPRILTSIKRHSGQDVIWFGQWTSPNGALLEGASKRTKAYKTASALIEKHLELFDPNIRHPDAGFNSKDFQGGGCFSVMFVLLLLVTFLVFMFVV